MHRFMSFAGTQVANTTVAAPGDNGTTKPGPPNPIQLLYIALVFGFALAVNAWVFFRVSGGLFNPAVRPVPSVHPNACSCILTTDGQVSLALALIGAITFLRAILVGVAQVLGALAAAGVVKALFPGPMAVTTALSKDTNIAQGLFIEMFLTAQLVFTIIMLAAEKHKGTFLAPVGIGLSLFIAELAGTVSGTMRI